MLHRISNSASSSLAVISLAYIAGLVLAYALGFIDAPPRDRPEPLLFPGFAQAIRTSIEHSLPEPHAGFLTGLLTGGTGQLSPEFRAAVTATGTMHLLALSGWNVGIISRGIDRLFRSFAIGRRARLVLSGSAVILFVFMVGASASVVRAAIMGTIVVLADFLGRPHTAGRALLLTIAVMLLFEPALIANLSFLLSVSATLGLIYLSPLVAPALSFFPKRFAIRDNAVSSVVATLATAPLILLTFGRFSLVSLPANLLLLPFIPLAMGIGFVGALSQLVLEPLSRVLVIMSTAVLGYCVSVIRIFARIPGSHLNAIVFNQLAAVLMVVGIVAVVMIQRYVFAKTKKVS